MKPIAIAALLIPLVMLAAPAFADSNNITISHAWSRATPSASSSAVVYLTVTDTGPADELVSASTPIAKTAQLHETKAEKGIMRMSSIAKLPISKDKPITLKPSSYHLMLTGMKEKLVTGENFPLTLTFTHAGSVSTEVTVAAPGAKQDSDSMPGMDMSH